MIYKKSLNILFVLFMVLIALLISVELPEASSEQDNQSSEIRDLLLRIENKVSDFKNLQTDFIQEKNLAIFQNKLIIKGRIYLQKPDKVAWHVDEPIKYSVLITDKFIRQWDEDTNQVQEISLSKNPAFRVVIDQLTAWFSGRYVQLLDEYNVHVKKDRPLQIEFVPRETNNVKKIIKAITITFREDERYLQKVKFQEVSGDSTIIFFKNTVLNAPVDENDFRVRPEKEIGRDFTTPSHLLNLFTLSEGRSFSVTG